MMTWYMARATRVVRMNHARRSTVEPISGTDAIFPQMTLPTPKGVNLPNHKHLIINHFHFSLLIIIVSDDTIPYD